LIKKLKLILSTFYQTFKIKLSINYFNFLDKGIDNDLLLTKKISDRGLLWSKSKDAEIFLICSIYNWEKDLVKAFKNYKKTYHFNWPAIKNFFKTKSEWKLFFNDLNNKLCSNFDHFYDQNKNIIVFIYASDFSISEKTLIYLKRKNVLLISFCWDDLLNFKGVVNRQPVGVSQISKIVDFNLTMSPETISKYNFYNSVCYFWDSRKINVVNSKINKSKIKDFYVLFIGSSYGHRGKFIQKLINKGIKLKCFGNGWENDSLNDEEYENEIRKAPLTLGFSFVGTTKTITTIKGRDFEVPLLGGLYLTQYSKGLNYYYDLGKDILTYSNFNDCLRKIKMIRDNPEIAHKIRNSGFNQARKISSWESRMKFLDNKIKSIINFQ
jgi:spore maturation protein CgeB